MADMVNEALEFVVVVIAALIVLGVVIEAFNALDRHRDNVAEQRRRDQWHRNNRWRG